jgi:hypothetical protein
MEQTRPPLSIFSPADIGLLAERVLRSPSRLKPGAAAFLVAAALALGVLGEALFVFTKPGINLPIWHLAVVAALLAGARACRVSLDRRQLALIALSLVLSSLIAWRGSGSLQAFNLMAAMLTMLLAIALPWRVGARRLGFVAFLFSLAVAAIAMATGVLNIIAALPWKRDGLRQAWPVGRALLLALPLLVVFGGLFIAADAVFESQAKSLINPDFETIGPHLFWLVSCTFAAAGVFWAALGYETPEPPQADLTESRRLRSLETGIVLGALALLFGLFVIVQVRYLFGGSDLVQRTLDLTYAEYARRGFFELVVVAALLLPALLLFEWARQRTSRSATVYRLLAFVLVLLLGVVMASALERLRIYGDAFGLTELRLYAAWFLVLLAAVFLCFCLTVLRGRPGEFIWGAGALAVIALVALNVLNPDATIARTNTSRLDEGRSFDAVHASGLGADAVPVLVERLDRLPATDRCVVATALLDRWGRDEETVRGWNHGRAEAVKVVRENEARLRAACP